MALIEFDVGHGIPCAVIDTKHEVPIFSIHSIRMKSKVERNMNARCPILVFEFKSSLQNSTKWDSFVHSHAPRPPPWTTQPANYVWRT